MRTSLSRLWMVAAVVLLARSPAGAAELTGFQADLLAELEGLEKKYLELAQAVPEAKFSWEPAPGVRSVSEVYMHAAAGNFMMPSLFGYPAPEGAAWNMEEQITAKAQVMAKLKASFEHARQAIRNLPADRLEAQIDLFGDQATVRRALLLMAGHLHEHLGQSIAYARVVGVTPPWSGAGEEEGEEGG